MHIIRSKKSTGTDMPRKSITPNFVLAILLSLAAPGVLAFTSPSSDVDDSHDHPLVSRFAGSVIVGYQTVDYDQMQLPMGKYEDRKLSKVETVEGKITRIAYIAPEGKSALEIYRNYMQALVSAGFHVRFECHGNAGNEGCGDNNYVGGHLFVNALYSPVSNAMKGDAQFMGDTLRANPGDAHSVTARLKDSGRVVDLSLVVVKDQRFQAGIFLQIAEHQPMATGQVTVDAKAIGEGLAQTGHIALYGLTFASDSASLDPGSQPTLVQMAKVLGEQPALKVYIVGHTDSTGNLAHNLDLSQRRAEAVVAALAKDYHIAPTRLLAKGMASFAPVASNDDESGRARNRRVELVKQ